MERKLIIQRIADIDSEISLVRNVLKTLEATSFITFPIIYERLSVEAAMHSERITCKFRHLIYSTLNITKPELMKKAAEAHGIEINYSDGVFSVVLPSLLPKKGKTMNSEFLTDPLYFALDDYFSVKRMERFDKCVVCFEHIYSKETPGRLIRDYDNVEAKQVLDVISAYVMVDDNGKFCAVYHSTGYSEKDCTKISVMNQDRFIKWLAER